MARLQNGTRIYGNTTVDGNNLVLGTSSKTANGYSWMPNGLKMNWGVFVCNTTSMITFNSAFATGVLSIAVTPQSSTYQGANTPYVSTSNTTTANIYSASTSTTTNCYFIAIGY
jgi:hypothetical protein